MQSSPHESGLDDFRFHVVPSSWMRVAWPLLTGNKHFLTTIPPIEMGELLVPSLEQSVGDDDTMDVQSYADPPRLRDGLKHEKDFCLLSPTVWDLVVKAYGCDIAIECKCEKQADRRLTVVGSPDTRVVVPAEGRLKYLELFRDSPGSVSDEESTSVVRFSRRIH